MKEEGISGDGRLERWELLQHSVPMAPSILTQPMNRTNHPGTTATFSVSATGTAPLSYQWRFNGADLANGDRISGANTPTLVLSDVQFSDAGLYQVVITNAYGSVTSARVELALPPHFTGVAISNGWLHTQLNGSTGSRVILETSTNLCDWTATATNTLPAGGLPLSWPIDAERQRFHRARQ